MTAFLPSRATFPLLTALLLGACSTMHTAQPGESVPAPRVAAHQHLISPAFAKIIDQPELDGAALLKLLDIAGIERGVVLSMGYSFGDERKRAKVPDADRAHLARVFFGSDMTVGDNPPPAESWAIFRAKVPLTAAEFRAIALNVPPYITRR